MKLRMTLVLLVVLSLSLTVLAGSAGSAVQVGLSQSDTEIPGVLHKDTGIGANGDDDRWGDAHPVSGDPDESDAGDDAPGGVERVGVRRTDDVMPGFGDRVRFFVDVVRLMLFAR